MTARDLVVLGTASQAPTRARNHNGYLLRWVHEGLLFDPGEGTQRQFIFAGVSPARVTRILLTHLHGDHCLGLPGMLQRIAMDGAGVEVPLHFPASGLPYVERLCEASIGRRSPVRLSPIDDEGGGFDIEGSRVTALPLSHGVPVLGWRVEAQPRVHLIPERLAALGIRGPEAGRLLEEGSLVVGDRVVLLDEVGEQRRGQVAAVVMDTSICDNAIRLAEGADLLLCEATFLESEGHLAREYGHLTARQAATIAREAGVGCLVLSHFSARYPNSDGHRCEAEEVFPHVVVADDLIVVDIPKASHGLPVPPTP